MVAAKTARRPQVAGGLLLVLMAVAVFYAPVWTNVALSDTAMSLRLFLPRWR
jgi:hypothetical protein